MKRRLTRWVMGYDRTVSIECLEMSIESFLKFHDSDILICHNCDPDCLAHLPHKLYDQRGEYDIKPEGVAWKLYPPRIDVDSHELVIDNDIIFEEKIDQIDKFFNEDATLLLEGESRTYGRFGRHVPKGQMINSGIFGMPPEFDFNNYVKFYASQKWELNATGIYEQSRTFDEQGIVAASLLSYHSNIIIPNNVITNCEKQFKPAKGMHFVGLNRIDDHQAFKAYQASKRKIYL